MDYSHTPYVHDGMCHECFMDIPEPYPWESARGVRRQVKHCDACRAELHPHCGQPYDVFRAWQAVPWMPARRQRMREYYCFFCEHGETL